MRDHEEFPWVSHKGLLCSGFVLQKAQQLFYPANPHLDLAASSGHCARTTVTCSCRAPRAALLMVRVTWVGRPCLGLALALTRAALPQAACPGCPPRQHTGPGLWHEQGARRPGLSWLEGRHQGAQKEGSRARHHSRGPVITRAGCQLLLHQR